MKTDLHNLLDQPLVGEPTLRTPREHLQRSRSMLRRRRLLRSGLAAGSAAAVIAITLSSGSLGSASAGKDAGDRDLVATQPPATPSGSVITTEVRERYPSQARIVDCLVAKGYNVTLGRDGGIGYEIATSGIDSYYAAEDVCTKAVEGDQPLDRWTS